MDTKEIIDFREKVLDLRLRELEEPSVRNELAKLNYSLREILNLLKPIKKPLVLG